MAALLLAFASLLLSPSLTCAATGTLGLDVSQPFDAPEKWSCLRTTANRTWGIVRAYHSYGSFDDNAPATLKAAHSGGLTDLDVYMFPCSSKNASTQAQDMVRSLGTAPWNSAWIDVETNPSRGCGWSKDTATNCGYLKELVNALAATGTAVGVYSSHYEWTTVMGSSCIVANHLPLWYARYAYGASCKDYSALPFGGWTTPYAKQYDDKGDASAASCGFTSADMSVKC